MVDSLTAHPEPCQMLNPLHKFTLTKRISVITENLKYTQPSFSSRAVQTASLVSGTNLYIEDSSGVLHSLMAWDKQKWLSLVLALGPSAHRREPLCHHFLRLRSKDDMSNHANVIYKAHELNVVFQIRLVLAEGRNSTYYQGFYFSIQIQNNT